MLERRQDLDWIDKGDLQQQTLRRPRTFELSNETPVFPRSTQRVGVWMGVARSQNSARQGQLLCGFVKTISKIN